MTHEYLALVASVCLAIVFKSNLNLTHIGVGVFATGLCALILCFGG